MNKHNENKAIVSSISPQRFQPFLSESGNDFDKAKELYEENVRLSAQLYQLLSFLEVCLRNKFHGEMKKKYGDGWLLDPRTPLQEKGREKIKETYEKLRARGKIVGNTPRDMGKIVAGVSLGFWVKLLARGRSHSLWCSTLRHAFPNYRGDLKSLKPKLNRIWELRNRVAHHELIIFIDNIEGRREEIFEVIGWMCKDTEEWVRGL